MYPATNPDKQGASTWHTFERRARIALLCVIAWMLVFGVWATISMVRLEQGEVEAARSAWLKAAPGRDRVLDLVERCERGNRGSGQTERLLTVDGCDQWVVAQARQQWAVDATPDLRALHAIEAAAVAAAERDALPPVRWAADCVLQMLFNFARAAV